MKRSPGALLLIILLATISHFQLIAQSSKPLKFSGKWYLAYDLSDDGKTDNEFLLKRGYFTVNKKLDRGYSFRLTQDVAVDKEGDGLGDIEIRLKYGYLRYTGATKTFLSNYLIEFGVVHRPWIDFEQKINRYRVQGTMFLERERVLRSADYGVMIGGFLGGKVDSSFQADVNNSYPGRYGSFAVGVYNGGGYEDIERNENKYVEGRFSLRPLPDVTPGLQVSLAAGHGKGNVEASPDFSFAALFLSYESRPIVLTANYYQGVGNLNGTLVDSNGVALNRKGYSLFTQLTLFHPRLKAFGRYDYDEHDLLSNTYSQRRYITGIAYEFIKSSKMLIDYESLQTDQTGDIDENLFEFALEINF